MTLAIDEVQVAYCREARRLRCVHADRPGRMLRALADLSARYNTLRRPMKVSPARAVVVRRVSDSPKSVFAEKIAAALAGDVLTYSRREWLIAEAGRLGIGRFEANLLIAEAQHRCPATPAIDEEAVRSPLALLAVALAAELLVAFLLYRLLM